ncbi:unnamed protein product [Oncorhynchus mykiss]|uniref:Uncharacterized protein n=1 Tax=Oncorhynchus mykiss TaxID=8022 RepID=A0A060W5G3_ONCMY|nr:unnamed protein product [Oncorhynchus mykiss]
MMIQVLFVSPCSSSSSRGFGQSNSLPTAGCVGGSSSMSARRSLRQFQMPSRSLPGARLGLLGTAGLLGPTPRSASSTSTGLKQGRQGLWFANPGGSNSMPSRTHSSVQRTRSLPVHTTPHTMVMFQQSGKKSHTHAHSVTRYIHVRTHTFTHTHTLHSHMRNKPPQFE